jgi:putative FmdB family regulatory protein
MPTYQYACTDPSCANRFELVQSFTDPAASECPVCSGPVRKVYGSVGVVFKGSGFYRTDSRDAASSAASAKSENGKSDGAKAEKADKADKAKSEPPKSDTSSAKTESSSSSTSSSPAAAAS